MTCGSMTTGTGMMRIFTWAGLLAAACALPLLPVTPAAAQPWPSDVAGSWNGRSATITRAGADFTVRLSNGRGPFRGRYTGGNGIRVAFVDDPGCCTGVITGNVIQWSNGTQWRRDVAAPPPARINLVGSWNRGTATIVPRGNGFAVRLSNGRGPFAGGFTGGDRISVNFVDDRGCCTGVTNGREIRWSNGTVWRKD
jgi:hypothetical protein